MTADDPKLIPCAVALYEVAGGRMSPGASLDAARACILKWCEQERAERGPAAAPYKAVPAILWVIGAVLMIGGVYLMWPMLPVLLGVLFVALGVLCLVIASFSNSDF